VPEDGAAGGWVPGPSALATRDGLASGPGGERGGAGVIPPEYEGYVRALRERVQARLVYPWLAVRRGQQGTVEVDVHVNRQGRLADVRVVGGPGHDVLRAAAVRAVQDAAPFPFPEGLPARPLVVRLPVVFRLR
jgi:protein TonB